MNLEEKLYTSTEVAKILGVSLRSVYRYLDQGKLDAEIKTATGRLRFTKKDILTFLYPEGDIDPKVVETHFSRVSEKKDSMAVSSEEKTPEQEPETEEALVPTPVPTPTAAPAPSTTKVVEEEPKKVEEPEEEAEIDWLSKFRAAAKEYSMEKEEVAPVAPAEEVAPRQSVAEAPIAKAESLSSLSGASEDESAPKISHAYYKSNLGGLKEIAQNIDKVARKSAVDYAFTLYAGLSLEKPLKKPFSVLHVYLNPSTEELFQKMLQLEETNEVNAQLCVMFPQSSAVFANKVEKHGLYVVDPAQMQQDFEDMGLSEELADIL